MKSGSPVFPTPWIRAGLVTRFCQQTAVGGIWCWFRARPPGASCTSQLPWSPLCLKSKPQASLLGDERPREKNWDDPRQTITRCPRDSPARIRRAGCPMPASAQPRPDKLSTWPLHWWTVINSIDLSPSVEVLSYTAITNAIPYSWALPWN